MMSYWITGTMAALTGLVGLLMAGAAEDTGILGFGLGLSLFGVLFCWFMIKTAFDEAERKAAEGK
jgi:Na+/melibiose symporter-like transporter